MLTVDEEFEAIVAGDLREVRADRMEPYREPAPEPKPVQDRPEVEKVDQKEDQE